MILLPALVSPIALSHSLCTCRCISSPEHDLVIGFLRRKIRFAKQIRRKPDGAARRGVANEWSCARALAGNPDGVRAGERFCRAAKRLIPRQGSLGSGEFHILTGIAFFERARKQRYERRGDSKPRHRFLSQSRREGNALDWRENRTGGSREKERGEDKRVVRGLNNLISWSH